jgi:hemolysin activation/secretion protein
VKARITRAALFISLVSSISTYAAPPPDAGTLLQQIEKESRDSLPGRDEQPRPSPAPEEMRNATDLTVEVRQFQFVGNSLLTAAQLNEVVKPWIGKSQDFNELKKAAQAVAQAYRTAGWVVRAYLPHQDVTEGTVTIQIVEGVFGKTQLDGVPPSRLSVDSVLNMVTAAQPSGKPVNADNIDRAVLLLGDLPSVNATASLKAGAKQGETDLVLQLEEGKLFTGQISADNYGSRATGKERLAADLQLNSPAGIGDQATSSLIHSRGNDYVRLAYSLPVGDNGLRAGINASYLEYDLIADEFKPLNADGRSNSFGVSASYPLIRTRMHNLYLGFNADSKHFDNKANSQTVTNYDIDSFSASLAGNRYDNFGGGGATSASLVWIHGRTNLNGSPNQATDAVTTRTDGSFNKLRYAVSRNQVITNKLNLYAALSGQAADKNLDSAEKFYLGGSNGVRAYPANEGGGSSGQLVNLELRQRLPYNFTLTGFYDWGHIQINEHNHFFGDPQLNNYNLHGTGLGINWISAYGFSIKAEWAHRFGNNPNPSANGNDQDGSLDKNRIWLNASYIF